MAKSFMDIAKIIIAAMFASEFFTKFPSYGKIILHTFLLVIIGVAFFVHPKGED